LSTDHPRASLPGQVQEILHDALAVRDRHAAGEISTHGAAIARGRLIGRLSAILEQSTSVAAIRRFAQHVNREWDALFTFLFALTTDATNWRAEHAIRWAVITRKPLSGAGAPPAPQRGCRVGDSPSPRACHRSPFGSRRFFAA